MDKPLFDRIVDLLLPHMDSANSRKALVQSALFGSPVVNHMDWSGAASEFTVRLVQQLYRYDVSAIVAVLQELHTQVGTTQQREIEKVVHALSVAPSSSKGQKQAMEPGLLIGFLVEVGRWAKSELSERWKVSREQEAADLTKKAEVEQAVPEMLQSAATASSPQRVQETINLIERKRDAIYRARNAKLADREEYDAQKLAKSAFEQRVKDHDKLIRQMLNEIEDDLNDLGFDVEREPA